MKGLRISVTACLIAVLLASVSFYQYKSGFVDITNGFFSAIKQKDTALVASYLSAKGKDQASAPAFAALVYKGIDFQFKQAGWFKQKGLFGKDKKELRGTIHPGDKDILVGIVFVKENGGWKLEEIKNQEMDLSSSIPMPSQEEQMALVRQAMHDFIVSKREKKMDHFYETIANAWKKETSVKKLNEAFASLIEEKVDWGFIDPVAPVLTKNVISKDGILVIVGMYPTKPKQLIFEQNFALENNVWKLVGIRFYASPLDEAKKENTQTKSKSSAKQKASK